MVEKNGLQFEGGTSLIGLVERPHQSASKGEAFQEKTQERLGHEPIENVKRINQKRVQHRFKEKKVPTNR